MIRILITGGGTTVPMDPVRNIANFSTGCFAASIAKAALIANMEVIYFVSAHGQSPFCETFDCYPSFDHEKQLIQLEKLHSFSRQYRKHYFESHYTTYEEYAAQLKKIILEQKPDIVVLAAAVSDYLVAEYSASKIQSSEYLALNLMPAPKIIRQIKTWLPTTYLVGFKLLVDASDEALINAAKDSIVNNNADLIVANDLISLQQGRHEIILVEKNGAIKKITELLPEKIIERVMRR